MPAPLPLRVTSPLVTAALCVLGCTAPTDEGGPLPIAVPPATSALQDVPQRTVVGPQGHARLGGLVRSAGDIDADGFDDLLVGADGWDGPWADGGRVQLHSGSAQGTEAAATWILAGTQADARLGEGGGPAGDVDGDGFDDLLVSEARWDGTFADEGRSRLFSGGAAGPMATTWEALGGQENASFGAQVAAVGDVDGDGFDDVAIAAHLWDGAEVDEGQVRLFHGGASGLSPSPSWVRDGGQIDAQFGLGLGPAGDVDADGYADLAVGAWRWQDTVQDEGAAFLFAGSATGLSPDPLWTQVSGQAYAEFGVAATGVGDVDGDGHSDVLIGAHGWDGGGIDSGAAFLFLGGAAGPNSTAAAVLVGADAGDAFGRSLSGAGDLDGDGRSDVVIGAPGASSSASLAGAAYAFRGVPTGLEPVSTGGFQPAQPGAGAGSSVGSAGDTNGDGRAEVVVGAPTWDGSTTDSGAFWVFSGVHPGPATTADELPGGLAGSATGAALDGRGDLDADGYADLLVGAPEWTEAGLNGGSAALHHGSPTGPNPTPLWRSFGLSAGDRFGDAVAWVGDVDGDGYDDAAVGAWLAGADDAGAVSLFYGGPLGLAPVADWIVTGPSAGSWLGASLAGAGDLDGDGYSDLVAGTPGRSDLAPSGGGFQYWFGGPDGLPSVADGEWRGSGPSAFLGSALALADVDGDQLADIVAGAWGADLGGADAGGVFPFFGPYAGSPTPGTAVPGGQAGALCGWSVTRVGDLDGDGDEEVAAGCPAWDSAAIDAGRVTLLFGAPGGPQEAAWGWDGAQAGAGFGRTVHGGFDADGDGIDDLLAVSDLFDGLALDGGEAVVFLGAPGGPEEILWFTHGAISAVGFGLAASAGDFDGDGRADLALGAEGGPNLEGGAVYHHRAGSGEGLSILSHPRVRLRDAAAQPLVPGTRLPTSTAALTVTARSPVGRAPLRLRLWAVEDGAPIEPLGTTTTPWSDPGPGGGTLVGETPVLPADQATDLAVRIEHRASPQLGPRRGPLLRIHRGASATGWTLLSSCDEDADADGLCSAEDLDDDGDGAAVGTDCDDTDDARYPGAPEACDTIDSDCDLSLVDGFADADTDLSPDCTDEDDDGDGAADLLDCAPLDAAISPAATELCDLFDANCDGSVVDSFPDADGDLQPDCADADDDGDGTGDAADCAPLDPTIAPSVAEACDGLDSDCDGSFTDGYADADFDGDPDCNDGNDDGDPVSDALDCAPTDAAIHPLAPEACDGIDSDCDGSTVDGFDDVDADQWPDCVDPDDDGDTFVDAADCGPLDPEIHPGAPESCDGTDSDCDGSIADQQIDTDGDAQPDCWDADDDGDGALDAADCAPTEITVHPGGDEVCDGLDSDCVGGPGIDEGDPDGDLRPDCEDDDDDDDGALDEDDCQPADPLAHPGALEACNGEDDDCDGASERDGEVRFRHWYLDRDEDGFGDPLSPWPQNPACAPPPGHVADDLDCADENPSLPSATRETGVDACADGLDGDCDGAADLRDDDCAFLLAIEPPPGCAAACGGTGAGVALLPFLLGLRRRRNVADPGGRDRVLRRGDADNHPPTGLHGLLAGGAGSFARSVRSLRAGLLSWAVLLGTPALSDAVAAVPLVIAPSADAGKLALRRHGLGRERVEIRELGANLDAGGTWLLGAPLSGFCAVPTMSAAELRRALDFARTRVDELETATGRDAIAQVRSRLGCLAEPASGEELWRLHFLEAVAASYSFGPAAALPALERALAMRPGAGFDPSYPPDLGRLYAAAQEKVLGQGHAFIVTTSAEGAGAAWVDGNAVPKEAGQLVAPGEHLLQIRGIDGVLRGGTATLRDGDVVVIGDPKKIGALLLRMDRTRQRTLARWLGRTLAQTEDRRVWVTDGGGSLVRLAERNEDLGSQRPGSVGIAARGGYQLLSRHSAAILAVDGDVRIAGPLHVTVHGRLSIGAPWTNAIDGTQSVPLLVPFGAGVEARSPGRTTTSFGLAFSGAFDQQGAELARALPALGATTSVRFLPGLLGSVGVDHLPREQRLRLSVRLEGGILGLAPVVRLLAGVRFGG